jgi:hypothetical protein
MKKDEPDWSNDDWIDQILVWAWGVFGMLVVVVLLFWLAAIFGLVP